MEHVSPYEPKISVHHVIDDNRHCSHDGECRENLLMTGWQTWRKVIIPDGRYMVIKDEVIGTCWPEKIYIGQDNCPWCLSLNQLNTVLDERKWLAEGTFQIQSAHFSSVAMDFMVTAEQAAEAIAKFAKVAKFAQISSIA